MRSRSLAIGSPPSYPRGSVDCGMLRLFRITVLSLVASLAASVPAWAQAPIDYRLSFTDYVRHLVDVEVVFSDVTADPLDIHMSRSSPGRYALHEFAKNVFDVQIS